MVILRFLLIDYNDDDMDEQDKTRKHAVNVPKPSANKTVFYQPPKHARSVSPPNKKKCSNSEAYPPTLQSTINKRPLSPTGLKILNVTDSSLDFSGEMYKGVLMGLMNSTKSTTSLFQQHQ